MIDDDLLVNEVRNLSGDIRKQRARCDRLLATAEPIARKARWAYSHFLSRTGRDPCVDPSFVQGYLHAWRDSVLCLANGPGHLKIDVPSDLHHTVLVGWHFPEHTALLHTAIETNTLVLVARLQSWMLHLRERNCLYSFGDGFSRALLRALSAGRPIYAMMDFCYPNTRHLVTNFLSYPALMPAGLLQLASRYNYSLRLVSIRGRTIQCIADIPVLGRCEDEIATDLNLLLEVEILRRPERWLLWPSVDQRWINVDYGDPVNEQLR